MKIHQFGKKVLPGIFLDYQLIAGGIWKEDILITDWEELEMLDASDIFLSKNQSQRSVDQPKMMNSLSQSQMEQQNCQEEITNSERPLQGGNNLYRLKISVEKFNANRKSFIRQNQQMTQKPMAFFLSIEGDFIYCHHTEPRVQLCAERRNIFFFPLKHIDVY